MAAKRFYDGEYSGYDERRKQERRDAGMINEDRSAIANMPQSVIYKEYAKEGYNMPEGLDDTMSGIEHQKAILDGAQMRKNLEPKKV